MSIISNEYQHGSPFKIKCQAVETCRIDGSQRDCGKEAIYKAYEPPIFFCEECLHECMEDASPEEQSTVKRL